MQAAGQRGQAVQAGVWAEALGSGQPGLDPMAEHLPSVHKALHSVPNTAKEKMEKRGWVWWATGTISASWEAEAGRSQI